MEKVIPKSKTNFYKTFSRRFDLKNIYSVDESDLQRDEVAIIKVFVKNIHI